MNSVNIILFICLLSLAACQRPSYAPNPVRYPDVAPRFRVATSTATVEFGNRNGEQTTIPASTEKLPIDARGNIDLINQIKNWPEDRHPFWYINRAHIENSRSQPVPAAGQDGEQLLQVNTRSRSPFQS